MELLTTMQDLVDHSKQYIKLSSLRERSKLGSKSTGVSVRPSTVRRQRNESDTIAVENCNIEKKTDKKKMANETKTSQNNELAILVSRPQHY